MTGCASSESVARFILSILLFKHFGTATDSALLVQMQKLLNTESLAQKGALAF